jgi:predicted PolB exonuclease-like 3'-5' exonuclease
MTNFGACRMAGGLDLLAKLLGKPGKTMGLKGEEVYQYYLDGKHQEINDYCLCDTLDTYFVFLRTRILTGDISPEHETELVTKAREYLEGKVAEFPILRKYLDGWTEFPSP